VKLSKEVKIGFATVIAFACFIYGFNFLKGKNFFASQNKFYAIYSDVDGLVDANPLIIRGYKVGVVTDIQLSHDLSKGVVVTMLLDNSINIPKNSVAKIVSSDIMGSKAIQLILGDSPLYAVDGDTLLADKEENLKQSVNKTIAPLQKKTENLISSIDSVMDVVQDVLNKDARKNLSGSFESINRTFRTLERTSIKLDDLIASERNKVSNILTKASYLATTLADNGQNISTIIKNFSDISDSLKRSTIISVVNSANTTLSQTAEIVKKINKGEGTLGLLVNNDSLYRKLDKSADDLDKLLLDLQLNPKRYVHFSAFGRKEKSKFKK
jgi:phospholipid/cholesterol/gamma-HCH transport system substrate-binding protein